MSEHHHQPHPPAFHTPNGAVLTGKAVASRSFTSVSAK
jgi:hypothetical protein